MFGVNSKGEKISFNPKQNDYFDPSILEKREYSVGHDVEARGIIRLEKKMEIANGSIGKITAIDENGAKVKWSANGLETQLTNEQMRYLDLGYARTTQKEQGATNHVEIFAVSSTGANVSDKSGQYVALTRAKQNIEIVTNSYETLLQRAGKTVDKTSAYEIAYSKDAISLHLDRSKTIATPEKTLTKDKNIGIQQSR